MGKHALDKYEPSFSTKTSSVKSTGSITLLVVAFLLNTNKYETIVEGVTHLSLGVSPKFPAQWQRGKIIVEKVIMNEHITSISLFNNVAVIFYFWTSHSRTIKNCSLYRIQVN